MPNKLLEWFEKYFYKKIGLLFGIIIIIFTIPIFYVILVKIDLLFSIIIYFVIFSIWIITWFYFQCNFPKTAMGKKGIYVAIETENEDQKRRIKNDFIKSIAELFQIHNISNTIQIHYLNEFQSIKISTILNDYNSKKTELEKQSIPYNESLKLKEIKGYFKVNKKINAAYYVWGDIRLRKDINQKYFLRLKGLVNHSFTTKDISKRLTEEFSTAFISNFDFDEILEKKAFDLIAESNFITSVYIIGIAALISNDLFTAYQLHKLVNEKINVVIERLPNLSRAQDTIKNLIAEEAYYIAEQHLLNNNLNDALRFNIEYEGNKKFEFNWYMQRIIIEFKLGNIDTALEFNNGLKKINPMDKTWIYNKAFLLMIKGEFTAGYSCYKQLTLINTDNEQNLAMQCIDFDKSVLKDNPELDFIYFIIGFLYFEKLSNFALALENYELFLSSKNLKKYPKKMFEKAQLDIDKIKSELKLNE